MFIQVVSVNGVKIMINVLQVQEVIDNRIYFDSSRYVACKQSYDEIQNLIKMALTTDVNIKGVTK